MKRPLALAGFLLTACMATAQIVYEKNADIRKPGAFHGIDASTGVPVVITPAEEEMVVVSCSDPSFAPRIVTRIEDGILRIYVDAWKAWQLPKNFTMKVYVGYKNLDFIEATSGASVKGEMRGKQLKSKVASGGIAVLNGQVEALEVTVNSGGQFKGYELVTLFMDAKSNSGGGIQATCQKELNASASSGGFINYKGGAVVRTIDIGSGGNVKRID